MRNLATLLRRWPSVTLLALGALVVPAIVWDVVKWDAAPGTRGALGPVAAAADADKAARKELKKAVSKKKHKAVKRAVERLRKRGGEDNQELILDLLPVVPRDAENIYWTLIEAACSFQDEEGLAALGRHIVKRQKAAHVQDLVYALGRSQSRHVIKALEPIALDGPDHLRDMAVRKIGKVYTKQSVDLLIQIMKKEEASYKDAVAQSSLIHVVTHMLIGMTGERLGPSSVNWEGWWSANRDKVRVRPRKKGKDKRSKGSTGTVIDNLEEKEVKEFFGEASPLSVVVLSAKYKNARHKGKKLPMDDYNNDHIENVLDRMEIPHTIVRRQKFEKFNLSRTGALVINCTQFHDHCICPTCVPSGQAAGNRLSRCSGCNKHIRWSAKLSSKDIKKIVKYVKRGGFLFGEDWIVKEVIERAFPKYMSAGTVLRSADLPEADVVPGRGLSTHPYLRGLYEVAKVRGRKKKRDDDDDDGGGKRGRFRHRWTIDDESWAFDVLNEDKVLMLLKSGRLEDHTDGQGGVAVAFRPGGSRKSIGRSAKAGNAGVVLMVLSHFGKQQSQRDEFALQYMLYNFLLDSRKQMKAMGISDKPRKKKGKGRDDDDDE